MEEEGEREKKESVAVQLGLKKTGEREGEREGGREGGREKERRGTVWACTWARERKKKGRLDILLYCRLGLISACAYHSRW